MIVLNQLCEISSVIIIAESDTRNIEYVKKFKEKKRSMEQLLFD